MRSYPVLDPVSQAYPEVQGRSPTCYSPVRHSSTPEGAFPFDLHVLSTPPAFVLSQDQTLQTKTPHHTRQGSIQSEKIRSQQDTTNWHPKKQPHPRHGAPKAWPKKQQQKQNHQTHY